MAVLNIVGDHPTLTGVQADILTVSELRERFSSGEPNALSRLGVQLTVEDDVESIKEHISHIALIELVFPHFKDGRPFSTAVILRRDQNFSGDLRASGDVLPDQVVFLQRSGFSSITVPDQFSVEQFKTSLDAYTVAYQNAVGGNFDVIDDLRTPSTAVAAQ